MDIEGSPRTVIAIPIKLGSNVSVLESSNCGWLCSETTHHFPLGGTTIGAAVLFVVLDIMLRHQGFVILQSRRSRGEALIPICEV